MKAYCVTLGFVPNRIWELSAARFYATKNPGVEIRHVFVDQHYPLNRSQNVSGLRRTCERHGIEWLDPGRNLGLHDGFNWALRTFSDASDDDVVIGYDPDSYPLSEGWDGALAHALAFDPALAWTSLMNARSHGELQQRGYDKVMVRHIETWRTRAPVVNSVCAWKIGFLRKAGGLWEPRPYYGHLESATWNAVVKQGLRWAFTAGWWEDDRLRDLHDREYVLYKWAHSHLQSFDGDFRAYLEAGCPLPEEETAPRRLP